MKLNFKNFIWIGALIAALIFWWPFKWRPTLPDWSSKEQPKKEVVKIETNNVSSMKLDSLQLVITYLQKENDSLLLVIDGYKSKPVVESKPIVESKPVIETTSIVKESKPIVKEKKVVVNTTTEEKFVSNYKVNTKKNEKNKTVSNPVHSYIELSKFLTDRYKDTIK